jgi:hypothetical protein
MISVLAQARDSAPAVKAETDPGCPCAGDRALRSRAPTSGGPMTCRGPGVGRASLRNAPQQTGKADGQTGPLIIPADGLRKRYTRLAMAPTCCSAGPTLGRQSRAASR